MLLIAPSDPLPSNYPTPHSLHHLPSTALVHTTYIIAFVIEDVKTLRCPTLVLYRKLF